MKLQAEMRCAASDVAKAFKAYPIWGTLGWNDVRNRYNRSRLGVFWASLSLLILVSALGPIYAQIMGVGLSEYVLHLALGFILWNYISGIVMESGREFVNSAEYLISFQLSYFTLLMRVVWRNLVVLSYQMLVFVLFAIAFQHPPGITWLMVPVALLLVTLNALWMSLLMSVLATRYRDVVELVNNLFRLAFFVTPIIWMPSVNTELKMVADLNPFYHLIELIRAPLSSDLLHSQNWVPMILMCLAGWLIAFPIFARLRSRIAFWL